MNVEVKCTWQSASGQKQLLISLKLLKTMMKLEISGESNAWSAYMESFLIIDSNHVVFNEKIVVHDILNYPFM